MTAPSFSVHCYVSQSASSCNLYAVYNPEAVSNRDHKWNSSPVNGILANFHRTETYISSLHQPLLFRLLYYTLAFIFQCDLVVLEALVKAITEDSRPTAKVYIPEPI